MTIIRKWSKTFGPLNIEEFQNVYASKSQKLFLELGLMRFNDGMGILSPFLLRSLRKIESLVRKEMEDISAQEILLPTLTNSKLLQTSGRINIPGLYRLEKSGDKNYILSPTHEEAVTNFVASANLTSSRLPCRLYQITSKFRDEKRARSGLLRSKEFVMKDLYCFDSNQESAEKCYEEVINKYHHFFQLLKVPYVCVKGQPGDIGGLYSHEFHFICDAGGDKLLLCQDCGHYENYSSSDTEKNCPNCLGQNLKIENGMEVGHAFNLGTTYTKPFNATFSKSKQKELLHMSCFGLGLTRLLAASVEVLCTDKEIKWPLAFAPYLVCVIPPKSGSIEGKAAQGTPELIYHNLNQCLNKEVVYFDSTSSSIGKRFSDVKKIGIPFVVIIGKNIYDNPPCAEIHEVYSGTKDLVQIPDVNQFVLNKLFGNSDFSPASCVHFLS